jgi:hypothetical protein
MEPAVAVTGSSRTSQIATLKDKLYGRFSSFYPNLHLTILELCRIWIPWLQRHCIAEAWLP